MPSSELNVVLQSRADTETNWNANSSIIPARGEICVVFMDAGGTQIKVGDGTSTFAQLAYVGGGSSGGSGNSIVLSPTQPSDQNEGDLWLRDLS